MKRVYFLKLVLSLSWLLLCSPKILAQDFKTFQDIQASYDPRDAQELKSTFKVNKPTGQPFGFAKRQGDLMEVDSLGVALYYKSFNQISGEVSNVIDLAGRNYLGFSGQGIIVGLWDSKLPRLDHYELSEALKVTDNADQTQYSSHATHVAGTLVSKGYLNQRAKGLVYNASLWVNDWHNDFEELVDVASKGILVSNHSYGVDPVGVPVSYFGGYLSSSQRLDAICVRYPYFQPVVAAGNDRENYKKYNPDKAGNDLLLGMATSKNAIVVAAVAADESKAVTLTSFSNKGPTDDFRIKPDISARGQDVLSTSDTSTKGFAYASGTSMATPVVSSIVAIWQQASLHFLNKPLWSSSVRAIMVHSAKALGGQSKPNPHTGWGLIDSKAGVDLIASFTEATVNHLIEADLKQGDQHRYEIEVSSQAVAVKVTLSWTDPEGNLKYGTLDDPAADLIHDLDLRVFDADGNTYYPWVLKRKQGHIETLQGDNSVDNIEQIGIENPRENQRFFIEVSHKNKLQRNVQAYSLVLTGTDQIKRVNDTNDTALNEVVRAWPNPVSDFLVLSGIDANTHFEFEVLTVLGKRLSTINSYFQNNNIILDVNDLSPGLYLVRIRLESGTHDIFFIKKV